MNIFKIVAVTALLSISTVGFSMDREKIDKTQLQLTQINSQLEQLQKQLNFQTPTSGPAQSRRNIIDLSKTDPNWNLLDCIEKNKQYYTKTFESHIETLNNKKIDSANDSSKKFRSWSMIRGTGSTILAALLGLASGYGFSKRELESAIGAGAWAVLLGAYAVYGFYKTYRYTERIDERLERDKAILKKLQPAQNDQK